MGMNVGTSASDEPEVIVDMNTTPLIDVMLVLLIMLIITIPAQLHSVNLDMPVPTNAPKKADPVVIKIDVDAEAAEFRAGQGEGVEPLERMNLRVENPNIDGCIVAEVPGLKETGVVISRHRPAGGGEVAAVQGGCYREQRR